MTQRHKPPILVLGIGNPLMGDEGIGIRIASVLMRGFEFPDTVELMDAGTMGIGMLGVLKDREFVLVVDAVDGTGHEPGTVVLMSPEDLAPNQIMHSLHDQKLTDVLEAAYLAGIEVNAECLGVQIARIEQWVTTLSEEVEHALPGAVEAVIDLLAERGIEALPREGRSAEGAILESIRTWSDVPDEP
jgi:hydrogenase maturation protease